MWTIYKKQGKKYKNLKKKEIRDIQDDMTYGDFKGVNRRTGSDKTLRDTAFNIAKNIYDGYQRSLASMVYTFFDKKTASGDVKNWIMENKKLAEKLYKPIVRKFEKQKVHSSFIDHICKADLAAV